MSVVLEGPHQHRHEQVELLLPYALIAFTLLAGLYRYIFVLRIRSYYRPLLAQSVDDDIGSPGSAQNEAIMALSRPRWRGVVLAIMILNHIATLTYVFDLVVVCLEAIADGVWASSFMLIYNITMWLAFMTNLALMYLETTKGGRWSWANYAFWYFALATETAVGYYHLDMVKGGNGSAGGDGSKHHQYDIALVALFLVRYVLLVALAIAATVQLLGDPEKDDLEALRTLDPGASEIAHANGNGYGTFPNGANGAGPSSAVDANGNKKLEANPQGSLFKDFWVKVGKVIPFIWPKANRALQVRIFFSFVLLAVGRIVNLLTPIQVGRVVRSLTNSAGKEGKFDPTEILLYCLLRYLQGNSGLVDAARKWLWIPVDQYSTRTMTLRFFEHVHQLSLHFHLNRKIGELLRTLDQGTSSVNSILSTMLFTFVPIVADLTIALVYFCKEWSYVYAIIILVSMVLYVAVTIQVTEWRTKLRREMRDSDHDARQKAVDSIMNFETVKYYSSEDFELNRYRQAIQAYLVADYRVQISMQLLNLAQNFVVTAGMVAGCLLCAYEITLGTRDVSNFMTFLMYMGQLYAPLHWFGTYYRWLQQCLIDMEKMLILFDHEQTVRDKPGAGDMVVKSGEVVFENVSFSYDDRQKGLSNVSFKIPKGKTVALVGPTGSGKSTILRLLFRFYDVSSGRILVDGQDISDVTQSSLRRHIGVVPQDTVLFNDTIYYNIHYGRQSATYEDVVDAAKAAQIHDKIVNFPDGYETMVGERGLRLSGGEKQRVAIARTILKNPPIVLLDEATSALDSATEAQIQAALARMTENRTTLVIAHRLSTIVNADLILCLKDGEVVEQGTHEELLAYGRENSGQGVYYEMWQHQSRDETAVDDATTVDGDAGSGSDKEVGGKGNGKGKQVVSQGTSSTAVIVAESLAPSAPSVALATTTASAPVSTSTPAISTATEMEPSGGLTGSRAPQHLVEQLSGSDLNTPTADLQQAVVDTVEGTPSRPSTPTTATNQAATPPSSTPKPKKKKKAKK
ncbi:ATP-binding cassette sub- B member 6, mitochondrial [Actinomortierella ambigua]|uniref:ATP-binding cassette sub- B member 6, mitochondrial n=1 Tax=Actinomortierella ambigua TaxID=1343610 RepID=A0A9P6PZH5_9FUNG|nr:ATP-binding cassette sub- B member 6, mitochondrial [Actinomortierella ambigua]